jgi:hypothetical protein
MAQVIEPITGVFRITSIMWTDGYKQAFVQMKFKRFPSSNHMKILLSAVTEKMSEELPKKYKKMLAEVKASERSSPRIERELVAQLKLFHYEHSPLNMKQTFYVFDYFPLFSDALEYEMTIKPSKNIPKFLTGLLESNVPMQIERIHGIYRDKKATPKHAITWMGAMQSMSSIGTAAVKKYSKLVNWKTLTDRDVEVIPNFREPRMNHRSKQFIRAVMRDMLDTPTAKLAPWLKPHVIKLLTPMEKQVLVRKVTENLEAVFDFDFEIHAPQLFQLWFGHEPDPDFEDAIQFKATLKNHMYAPAIVEDTNKYLTKISLEVKQYVGSRGSIGVPGNEDVKPETFYTLKSLKNRYEKIIERFRNCTLCLGTPAAPRGVCVVAHPDDGVYWRQTADVDEIVLLTDVRHRFADAEEITLYAAHTFDFQHWVLLEKYLSTNTTVNICGRLDQYATGRQNQLFRDLVELRGGIQDVLQGNLFLTSEVFFVKKLSDIPDDVEQIFTSAWSKNITSKWLHEHSERRFQRYWLPKPRRVRTLKMRTDGGWCKFNEEDEPALKVFNIDKYESADIIPLQRWHGRLLNSCAFIADPDRPLNNFDLYIVRTIARKIYYVGLTTLPSDSGRLPSRRTLRHLIK